MLDCVNGTCCGVSQLFCSATSCCPGYYCTPGNYCSPSPDAGAGDKPAADGGVDAPRDTAVDGATGKGGASGGGGAGTAGAAGSGAAGSGGGAAGSGGGGAAGSGAGGAGGSGGAPLALPPSLDHPCLVEGWGQPSYATFSDDGTLYAVGTQSGIIKLQRTADDHTLLAIAAQDSAIATIALSPDGSRIASAGTDGTIRVFTSAGALLSSAQPLIAPVRGLSFSPDGARLAAIGEDDYIVGRVLNVSDGSTAATFTSTAFRSWAQALAFQPDGATVLTYGAAITSWNATTGAMLGTTALGAGGVQIGHMDLSADKSTFAIGDYTVSVYDAHDGHIILADVGFSGTVEDMRLSGDGKRLALRPTNDQTNVYDARTRGTPASVAQGFGETLALGATGDDLVVEGDMFGATDLISHWHVGAGTHATLSAGLSDGVSALRLSPDGVWRAVVDGTGSTTVTRFADGSPVASFAKSGYDDAWFWPPDAQVAIATATGVDVAPLPSGAVTALPAAEVDGQLVAISPDGGLLAYASATSIVVRDRSGNLTRSVARTGTRYPLAFSPTGDRLALGLDDGTLQVLSLTGGTDVGPVSAHAHGTRSVAFAPDGLHVFSGGADNLGILWRASDLANVRSFSVGTGTTLGVTVAAVSPDGTLVAFAISGMAGYQARLFRVADATLVTTFTGFEAGTSPNAIAFSPDSRRVILGGGDNTIRTWCLP
jgi:WD40 repeat protein